jgi:hypothetical protein
MIGRQEAYSREDRCKAASGRCAEGAGRQVSDAGRMLGVTKVTIVGNQRLLLFGYPNTRNFLFGNESRSEYANCGSLCSPSSTLVATSAFCQGRRVRKN